jgi:hypothetical protein
MAKSKPGNYVDCPSHDGKGLCGPKKEGGAYGGHCWFCPHRPSDTKKATHAWRYEIAPKIKK